MRPPALAELGLLHAVELLLRRADAEGSTVSIVVHGDARRLAPQSELALFRFSLSYRDVEALMAVRALG